MMILKTFDILVSLRVFLLNFQSERFYFNIPQDVCFVKYTPSTCTCIDLLHVVAVFFR